MISVKRNRNKYIFTICLFRISENAPERLAFIKNNSGKKKMFSEKTKIDLQNVLDEYTSSGKECGCQLAVYHNGKLLYDLASGWTDESREKAVDTETLFPIFSVGKGIMTTLIHVLHEEGLIDYDAPVTHYWKEYGKNGKEKTLVKDILSHRAGIAHLPDLEKIEDKYNWEYLCRNAEETAPILPIGGKHQYHASIYGVLTGHLAECATGRSLTELLQEKLFAPLGIENMFFTLPDNKYGNLAKIVNTENQFYLAHNEKFALSGLNPSSNGTSNARSLAMLYASLIGDGLDGKRLISGKTIENATTLCRSSDDPVLPGQWSKFGLGYALCAPAEDYGRMFGHGGACGSEGFADKKTRLAVGFTKNRALKEHPNHEIRNRISEILELPSRIW